MTPVPPLDPQRFARAFAAAMQAVQQGGPCAAIVAGVPICVTGQPFDLALLTMWRVYPARSAGEAYAIARRWMALLELLAAWPPDWPWPATPEPGCRYVHRTILETAAVCPLAATTPPRTEGRPAGWTG